MTGPGEWQKAVVGTALAGVGIGLGAFGLMIGLGTLIGRAIRQADQRERRAVDDPAALLGVVTPVRPDQGSDEW